MRIWRIDVACWVTLLVLGVGLMVTGFFFKEQVALLILFLFSGYVLLMLAFLFSNLSIIEGAVGNLPNWATSLLAWMGMPKAVAEQVETLREAMRMQDEQRPKRIMNTLNIVVRRNKMGLKHPNCRVRKEAVEMLGQVWELEETEIISLLVGMLDDLNADVRRSARLVLSKIGPPAMAALKSAFHKGDPELRKEIYMCIKQMKKRAKEGLKSEDWRERLKAVNDLGQMHPVQKDDIIALASALNDEYSEVRLAVVEVLASIGSPLLKLALKDPEEEIREKAMEGLNKIDEMKESLGLTGNEEDIEQPPQPPYTGENGDEEGQEENAEPPLSEKLKEYFQLQDSIKSEYSEITFVDIDITGSTNLKEGESKEAVVYSFGQYNQMLDDIVHKYRGEQFNRIGDGRILRFADATDAVKMGIELQNALLEFNKDETKNRLNKPFKVRIGVNTGDCLIDPVLETSDVADHTLDVACHLQKYSEPDTVYISENTYSNLELSGNQFEGPVDFPKDNIKIYIYRL